MFGQFYARLRAVNVDKTDSHQQSRTRLHKEQEASYNLKGLILMEEKVSLLHATHQLLLGTRLATCWENEKALNWE